jgi:hypothetical protein
LHLIRQQDHSLPETTKIAFYQTTKIKNQLPVHLNCLNCKERALLVIQGPKNDHRSKHN